MNEEDVQEVEQEDDFNYETDPITVDDVLDMIQQQQLTQAGKSIESLLANKVSDVLDQEKIRIANTMYNDEPEEEELASDEEVEDMLDELESELDSQDEEEVDLDTLLSDEES